MPCADVADTASTPSHSTAPPQRALTDSTLSVVLSNQPFDRTTTYSSASTLPTSSTFSHGQTDSSQSATTFPQPCFSERASPLAGSTARNPWLGCSGLCLRSSSATSAGSCRRLWSPWWLSSFPVPKAMPDTPCPQSPTSSTERSSQRLPWSTSPRRSCSRRCQSHISSRGGGRDLPY
jgi:hypothetical protein